MASKTQKTKKNWFDQSRLVIPGSRGVSYGNYYGQSYQYYDISDTIDLFIGEADYQNVINCLDEEILVITNRSCNKHKYLLYRRLCDKKDSIIEVDSNLKRQKEEFLEVFKGIKLIILTYELKDTVNYLEEINLDFTDLIWDKEKRAQNILVYLKHQMNRKYSEMEGYGKNDPQEKKDEFCINVITEEFKHWRLRLFLDSRDIKYLVHFTRLENIESIKKNGILSKMAAEKRGVFWKANDRSAPNQVYLTIEFPNYKMFYSKSKGEQDKWVVILLKAYDILSELKCSFCIDNSARTGIKQGNKYEDLVDLFSEINRSPRCKKKWTTNPQAEVIVDDYVAPKYIERYITKADDPNYFSWRDDYE